MFTFSIIIPAAGSGSRMQTDIPKPFLPLYDKTVLEHTVDVFRQLEQAARIIIPVSEKYMERVRLMFAQSGSGADIHVIEGGSERQYSVINALSCCSDVDLIAVHDAVRPFVTSHTILSCCEAALDYGAAVPGVVPRDTIKQVDESGFVTATPDRQTLRLIQTPQVFQKKILLESYEKVRDSRQLYTDDASVVEAAGFPVKLIPGDEGNFKLTWPQDLERARSMFDSK